jgi:hypothetical protein
VDNEEWAMSEGSLSGWDGLVDGGLEIRKW